MTFPGSFLCFTQITLTDIAIPDLTQFLWPLRDFKSMESLILKKITWKAAGGAPEGYRVPAGKLRCVEAQDCTDNSLICLRAWQLYDLTFLWVQLPDSEQLLFLENATLRGSRDSLLRSKLLLFFRFTRLS